MLRIALLVTCAVGFVCPASASDPVNWLHDYQQALKVATTSGKTILIDCVDDSCIWCEKLEEEVYSSSSFRSLMQQFVPLRIHVDDGGEGGRLGDRYRVGTLPTLLAVDASERLLYRISGYRGADDLAAEISMLQDLVWREQTDPMDWQNIQSLAEEYLQRDMSAEAEMRFEKLIRAPIPETSKEAVHFFLAMAQYYQKKNSEAIHTLDIYGQTYPNGKSMEDALLLLSQIHLEMENRVQAKQILEEFLKRFPDSKSAGRAREVLKKL